jgi:hypothetical protein
MVGLFAQMWLLELAAFLLGAAVTWLVFVRPARSAARAAQPTHTPPEWATAPPESPGAAEPEPSTFANDPALAALDAHARHARRNGFVAADVLSQLNGSSLPPVGDGRER